MRSLAYYTWNKTILFASNRRESSRLISHNEHSADYVLSAVCLPIRSTSTSFNCTFWHRHRKYRSAHRDWFPLVSHSFPITLQHLLLFRFLRIAPFIPSILSFIIRNCSVWDYNSVRLQGTTSSVCCNFAVSSPCTRTKVKLQNSSFVSLLQRQLTSWFPKCSSRSLDLYAGCLEEANAATVDIKGKPIRHFGHFISRATRNAHSCYGWLLKRNLTIGF